MIIQKKELPKFHGRKQGVPIIFVVVGTKNSRIGDILGG